MKPCLRENTHTLESHHMEQIKRNNQFSVAITVVFALLHDRTFSTFLVVFVSSSLLMFVSFCFYLLSVQNVLSGVFSFSSSRLAVPSHVYYNYPASLRF